MVVARIGRARRGARRRFSPAATAGSTAFAAAGADGKPELLWKFDTNPEDGSVWKDDGSGNRNNLVATPVDHEGRVYVAVGAEPDYGEGPGCLWCIDPTRRGDVSPELVIDTQGKPMSGARRAPAELCDRRVGRRNAAAQSQLGRRLALYRRR